jgi:hypothetical protein
MFRRTQSLERRKGLTHFWEDIKSKFELLLRHQVAECHPDQLPVRSQESLKNRFSKMILPTTNVFIKYLKRQKACPPSGTPTEEEILSLACELYRATEGKAYQFPKCVAVLQTLPRFNPIVSDQGILEVTDDGQCLSNPVNTIGAPMGAALPRPIGNKKAKKDSKG